MSLSSDVEFLCPYCGSTNTISLERGHGKKHQLITDCETCCRPIVIHVRIQTNHYEVTVRAENEG